MSEQELKALEIEKSKFVKELQKIGHLLAHYDDNKYNIRELKDISSSVNKLIEENKKLKGNNMGNKIDLNRMATLLNSGESETPTKEGLTEHLELTKKILARAKETNAPADHIEMYEQDIKETEQQIAELTPTKQDLEEYIFEANRILENAKKINASSEFIKEVKDKILETEQQIAEMK